MSDEPILFGVIKSKRILEYEMERLGWLPGVRVGTDFPEFVRCDNFVVDGEVQYEPVSFDRFWKLIRKHGYTVKEDGMALRMYRKDKPSVITRNYIKLETGRNVRTNRNRRVTHRNIMRPKGRFGSR